MKPITIAQYFSDYRNGLLIDVRSPGEYEAAHVAGALSLPLFTNDERKIVGITYKQQSREQAIKLGLDFWGSKMRPTVEQVEKWQQEFLEKNPGLAGRPPVVVHCWRGGLRSSAVAWLLDLYGFNAFTIVGGYKSFRKWCIKTLEGPWPFKVLGGHTGSGKSAVLGQLIKKGEPVLDLEAMASHKGSAFGNINMPQQPGQEMFENNLALRLHALRQQMQESGKNFIWVEDESQRIGDINMPFDFYKQLRQAPLLVLDIPFEERLQYLIKDYGRGDLEKLVNATIRIQKRLGGLEAKKVVDYLMDHDLENAFAILLRYYDKWYDKAMDRHRPEDFMEKVSFLKLEKVDEKRNARAVLQAAQTAPGEASG